MIEIGDFIIVTMDMSSMLLAFDNDLSNFLSGQEIRRGLQGSIFKVHGIINDDDFIEYQVKFDQNRNIYLFNDEVKKANIVDLWRDFINKHEEKITS